MVNSSRGVSRRRFLLGAAGSAALASSGRVAQALPGADRASAAGESTVPAVGPHQAGIDTPLQAAAIFTAYTLAAGTTRLEISRLMQLWTDDISRLTRGQPALGDPVPELAAVPARLTATVGFGPGVFAAAGLQRARPSWLRPLPAFTGDQLEARWSDGDLLVQLCADDPVTLAHADQVLTSTASSFATVAWQQHGFQRARGMTPEGTVGRNLMGFVDGIVNPSPGTADFDSVVWNPGRPAWLKGGSCLIVRRIRMDLGRWSSLSTRQREEVFGRTAADGSPLSGGTPHDRPDLEARDANGLSAIPLFSHVRLAAPAQPGERLLRRPFNYDSGQTPNGPDAGLIFAAYCADPDRQYVAMQRRLADHDLLSSWVTAVGSAVFAVPPGFGQGGYLGESLLRS
jgi:dye decolorizing peroxidase